MTNPNTPDSRMVPPVPPGPVKLPPLKLPPKPIPVGSAETLKPPGAIAAPPNTHVSHSEVGTNEATAQPSVPVSTMPIPREGVMPSTVPRPLNVVKSDFTPRQVPIQRSQASAPATIKLQREGVVSPDQGNRMKEVLSGAKQDSVEISGKDGLFLPLVFAAALLSFAALMVQVWTYFS